MEGSPTSFQSFHQAGLAECDSLLLGMPISLYLCSCPSCAPAAAVRAELSLLLHLMMSLLPRDMSLYMGKLCVCPQVCCILLPCCFPVVQSQCIHTPALGCEWCFCKRHGHSLKAVGGEESENGVVQGAWQTCLARRLMHTCCPPSCRSKTSCTPTGQPHAHPPWPPLVSLPYMYCVSCCGVVESWPVLYQLHPANQSPLLFCVLASFVYQACSLCISFVAG